MEAKFAHEVEKDDVLMDDAEIGGSHPGNGYFSGLLLQKSRDFAHCITEQEEQEIGAIVWSKVVEERQGRFLISDSEPDRFIVLKKAAVIRKVCKAFKDLLPMARKKPRLEQTTRMEPTATVSPGAGVSSRRLVWTEEEEAEQRKTVGPSDNTDTGSEAESSGTPPRVPVAASPVSGQSSPVNDAQEDAKSASSAEDEEPKSPGADKASSSGSVSSKRESVQGDDKMHRMLFKQLRALHREVREMKQDNAMLHQDVSRLTKDCGAFQREILALKKTRGHLQHELIELRNNHKALLSVIRNDQSPPRVPEHLSRPAPAELRKEDILQQDLFELKRRLKEQQRLTDSLLEGGPSVSPGGRLDHLDPSLLSSLGRQSGYGIGVGDLPGGSDSLRRAQNNEDLMRGLKRKSPSRGWH